VGDTGFGRLGTLVGACVGRNAGVAGDGIAGDDVGDEDGDCVGTQGGRSFDVVLLSDLLTSSNGVTIAAATNKMHNNDGIKRIHDLSLSSLPPSAFLC
jgi:hypothetical protein